MVRGWVDEKKIVNLYQAPWRAGLFISSAFEGWGCLNSVRELFERGGFFNSAKMNMNSSYEPSRAQSGKDHRQDEVGGHAAEDQNHR